MQSQTLHKNNKEKPLCLTSEATHSICLCSEPLSEVSSSKHQNQEKMIGRFFYPSANIKDEADASCTTSLYM